MNKPYSTEIFPTTMEKYTYPTEKGLKQKFQIILITYWLYLIIRCWSL